MGGLISGVFAATALVAGAGSASAVTITGPCAAIEHVRVYACSFSSQGECNDWMASKPRPTGAGCRWSPAGSHMPDWNNEAGYIGAHYY